MRFLGSNQTPTTLIMHMGHLSAAGSSATRNLTTTEPPKSLNRRKTVNFRFQRPHATSGSFFFNKPMRAMDSRRDFTSKKVFPGYFSELSEKANPSLLLFPSSAVKRKVLVGRSVDICSSHPATQRVIQQRFALLWGRGKYGVYKCKNSKKMMPLWICLQEKAHEA